MAAFLDLGRPFAAAPVVTHPAIRSLAVLPLENASADPDQQYFADEMTDTLVAEIKRTDGLRVISHASAAILGAAKKDRAEVARQLHVDAVVQGSVRRAGPKVRVAV